MVEKFSLFRSESGLNLPHIYEIKLSVDTIHERPESLSASRSEESERPSEQALRSIGLEFTSSYKSTKRLATLLFQ